jgi:hypothetical protein
VKSYVSVLDLAFQIDKGKDKPIDNVPEVFTSFVSDL